MNTSIPKRQHYVPQMLLRRFTDDDGKLYFFSKQFPEKGIREATPQYLFQERNLYTATQAGGTKDVALERNYAALEGRADGVIEKILASARCGRELRLTKQERDTWDVFFYSQWKRVPDFHRQFLTGANFDRHLSNILSELEAYRGPLTPDEERKLRDPQWRKTLKQNVTVDSLKRLSPRILSFLGERGLGIAIIRKIGKSFVIGSFPLIKLTLPGRSQLGDPTVEVWLPIAHDVAIGPAPLPGTSHLLVEVQDRHVRHINVAIFKQSTIIAGKSRRLIASLMRSR